MKSFNRFSLIMFLAMVIALVTVPTAIAVPAMAVDEITISSAVDVVAPEIVPIQVACTDCKYQFTTGAGSASGPYLYDMDKSGITLASGSLGVFQAFAQPSVILFV